MNQLYGVDVSEWQGVIDWDELNTETNFVIIRMTDGTLTDKYGRLNQSEARRVRADAGPLGIGYYTYVYPTLLSPVESAAYFVQTVGELQPGEILACDLEGDIGVDPVSWTLSFLQAVEVDTLVKPLLYLNQSEKAGYNWQPVVDAGFGLWEAQYSSDRTLAPAAAPWPVVAGRQWSSTDLMAGISTKVDGDTFFGTFDQFYAYGSTPASAVAPQTPAPVDAVPPVATQPAMTVALPLEPESPASEAAATTTEDSEPAAPVPPAQPATTATAPAQQTSVVASGAGQSSQPVKVVVQSQNPSSSPVSNSKNNNTAHLQLDFAGLTSTVESLVAAEMAKYATPANEASVAEFFERKLGQVIATGAIGTGVVIGTASATGIASKATDDTALAGVLVTGLLGVFNLIIHAAKK